LNRFVVIVSLAAAGCAARPPVQGFPVQLPSAIDGRGRAIAVVGDLQMTPWLPRTVMRREFNGPEQRRLIDDLDGQLNGIGTLVIAGDLVFTGGSNSDWRHFDTLIGPIAERVPVLPAIGNHDYHCILVRKCFHAAVPKEFVARFPWFEPGRPYFVTYDNLGLAFIDSEIEIESQASWLEQTLDRLPPAIDALIVFTHRPPYTDSVMRGVEPNEDLQRYVVPVLADSPVTPVVISGHAHGYEHMLIGGIHYIVSAGGGGPRGALRDERPDDVYSGADCTAEPDAKTTLRPLNYVLIETAPGRLRFTVRGFCKQNPDVTVIESFDVPLSQRRGLEDTASSG
jgi:Calcineurin-like phosphoesterase